MPIGTHYERALEAYLKRTGNRYVAVDQARKAIFAGVRIKSFDFIVYPQSGAALLADVKGRKFSLTSYQKGLMGPSWVTRDDIDGLGAWADVFGQGYRCGFVFSYWLTGGDAAFVTTDVFEFERRHYTFHWVDLPGDKRYHRHRSPKWDTIDVPAKVFRQLARPLGDVL